MIFVYLHETAEFGKSSQLHLNYTEKKKTPKTQDALNTVSLNK